jgi:hypothetical protein
METTINKLRTKIIALGERAFFNPPADEDAIKDVEERLKITFPASVRDFYKAFNGGFFADTSWEPDELKDAHQFETIQWNSNNILTLEDIKLGFGSRYPDCVPVIHTHTQEFLAFINPLNDNESPVYDAFHEYPPQEWGVLYNNFEELLNDYIDKEGNIKTIAV